MIYVVLDRFDWVLYIVVVFDDGIVVVYEIVGYNVDEVYGFCDVGYGCCSEGY